MNIPDFKFTVNIMPILRKLFCNKKYKTPV